MKDTQLPVLTEEYKKQAAGMIRQYADKLIQMGYGFTRRQLKEMNYIDVQEFFEKKSNHNSMKREYLDLGKTIPQDQYFYYLIPCYKEGVFYIGMDQYMYWQVKDISMEDHTLTVYLMMHTKQMMHTWCPGLSGLYKYTFAPADTTIAFQPLESMSVQEVIHSIPLEQFSWTSDEKDAWRKFQNTIDLFAPVKDGSKEDAVYRLGKVFLTLTTVFNRFLQTQKSHTVSAKSTRKTGIQHHMEIPEQPERKTTYIGNVQIRSSQKPRKPCTSITYHVDSWTKRGHIRHYKSGKTVYISEKVCHRRKAETTKPTNAKIIIVRKGEKP